MKNHYLPKTSCLAINGRGSNFNCVPAFNGIILNHLCILLGNRTARTFAYLDIFFFLLDKLSVIRLTGGIKRFNSFSSTTVHTHICIYQAQSGTEPSTKRPSFKLHEGCCTKSQVEHMVFFHPYDGYISIKSKMIDLEKTSTEERSTNCVSIEALHESCKHVQIEQGRCT